MHRSKMYYSFSTQDDGNRLEYRIERQNLKAEDNPFNRRL